MSSNEQAIVNDRALWPPLTCAGSQGEGPPPGVPITAGQCVVSRLPPLVSVSSAGSTLEEGEREGGRCPCDPD